MKSNLLLILLISENDNIFMKRITKKGFSLIEILVVISIFALIGILTTRSIFTTLRSARKSDSLVKVREDINYAVGVIERQIRSAESVNCSLVTARSLPYIAEGGISSSFDCTIGANGAIASGSASPVIITSSDVTVTGCVFTCTQSVNNPPSINISITAEDKNSSGTEKGSVTSQTEILLRNY